jgi:hypothetical protein
MKTVMENVNTGDITEFDETENLNEVDDISEEEFFAFLEELISDIEKTIEDTNEQETKE